jgi:putative ABC transport system ATP-binding protein
MSSATSSHVHRTPVLEFLDVAKRYKGTPPVRALDGVNLRVDSGEMFAVVGQSGSGKSTLLNLAGALDRPTSGAVRIDGRDVSRLSDARLSSLRGRRIGFVFQQFVLIDGLSALANVAAALVYRGLSARKRRARAVAALERVGLGDRINHRPGQLSGGEQQRVAIARALYTRPELLVLDEATSALDDVTEAALIQALAAQEEDTTVIMVAHRMASVQRADRVIVVAGGVIVDSGDVEGLVSRGTLKEGV